MQDKISEILKNSNAREEFDQLGWLSMLQKLLDIGQASVEAEERHFIV